ADAILAALAPQSEFCQRADDPVLKGRDEGANVAAAAFEGEHDRGNARPGAVIRELPAAARGIDREAVWIDEIALHSTCTGRIERWMFEQPDALRRIALGDGGHFGIPAQN